MNDLILLAKALADPTRVRVIAALRHSDLCVCELCDALEMSQSTLSTHLQTIRQARLVRTRKSGKWVIYRLEPEFIPLLDALFTHFQGAMNTDKRLRRDAERVARRLALRVNGCCVLGFGQLDSQEKGGERE